MKPRLFLEYLPWLRTPEYYYTSKFDNGSWTTEDVKGAIESDKKMYVPEKFESPKFIPGAPNCLAELYEHYDLRNVHMLWTTFWTEPKKLERGWGFADLSETNLVVASNGRIEAYHAHPIRGMPGAKDCLAVLANDLESYLEAMLCGAMNVHHFIAGLPDRDPILFKKRVLAAKQCALIAGGYEYYDFWAGLLGLPHTDTIPES